MNIRSPMQERDAKVAVDVAVVALGDDFGPDLAAAELLELVAGILTAVKRKPEAALENRDVCYGVNVFIILPYLKC